MLWQKVAMAWFQLHHFPGEMEETLENLSVNWQSPSLDWNHGSRDDKAQVLAAWLWCSMGTVNHPFHWITTDFLTAVSFYTGEDTVNVEWISYRHSNTVSCWLTGEQIPAGHVPTVWCVDQLHAAESCLKTNNSLLVTNISLFWQSQSFITVLTKRPPLVHLQPNKSCLPNSYWRSILILSPVYSPPSGLLPSNFPNKTLFSTMCGRCSAHHIHHHWSHIIPGS